MGQTKHTNIIRMVVRDTKEQELYNKNIEKGLVADGGEVREEVSDVIICTGHVTCQKYARDLTCVRRMK